MMNRPIDGTVLTARLARAGFGERVYRDVALRRRDGTEVALGRVVASGKLADALTPGREGRFSFHDVMGAQGLHGFMPTGGGQQRIAFPMKVERAFGMLALANLAFVAAWLTGEWGLPLVPLMLGVLATAAWAVARGCREALLHDLRYETRSAAARSHRRAVMSG